MRFQALAIGLMLLAFLTGNHHPGWSDSHIEDDLQLWVPVSLELPLTNKWSSSLQVESRLRDNISKMSQLIVLPTVSYKLNDNVSFQGGYGWYPTFNPQFRSEQRILQQMTLRKDFPRLKISLRSRIEERFIEDTDRASVRNRYLLRLETPIKKGPWYLVSYDEFLINLNSVENGPKSGIDQNRIFAGLGRRIGEKAQVEGGYHLQHINGRRGANDQMNHAILLRLNYRLR